MLLEQVNFNGTLSRVGVGLTEQIAVNSDPFVNKHF
jgi:hypothetical protein